MDNEELKAWQKTMEALGASRFDAFKMAAMDIENFTNDNVITLFFELRGNPNAAKETLQFVMSDFFQCFRPQALGNILSRLK